jgi:putative ABC transport system ATP-binding protein
LLQSLKTTSAAISNTSSRDMVRLRNVSKDYGDAAVHALRNVSLSIRHGERVAIMGPSGSGKSTLLNLICGLDEATSGTIELDGQDLASLGDDARTRLRREKIGMIFQTFNLLPTLTAMENVALPLRLQGLRKKEAERRALAVIDRVSLTDRSDHRPDALSGGERQRVAIARALIFAPPLLLADEPTGNLDSKTGEEILSLLDALHAEYGSTLILVTHNSLAAAHCDRLITFKDGTSVMEDAIIPDNDEKGENSETCEAGEKGEPVKEWGTRETGEEDKDRDQGIPAGYRDPHPECDRDVVGEPEVT